MAILEKEVWITLNPKNMEHILKFGYIFPKEKDKRGVLRIPRGTKILVNIEHLQESSAVGVTKICDDCGRETENQQYGQVLKYRRTTDGRDRCHPCSAKYAGENRKNNVNYNSSLESEAKIRQLDYLLTEFSLKNFKKPNEISYGTSDRYLWDCPMCQSEYDMPICKRLSGQNCPFCSGSRINLGNCLNTTHPHLADEWISDERNGEVSPFNVTKGNVSYIWWKCLKENCRHEWITTINSRTNAKSGCPKCNESKGEKIITEYLMKNNIDFTPQYRMEECKNKLSLPFDFAILKNGFVFILLEYDGELHYNISGYANGEEKLKKIQQNDKIKTNYCITNNIPLLRIKYTDFDNIEKILTNELIKLNIDIAM